MRVLALAALVIGSALSLPPAAAAFGPQQAKGGAAARAEEAERFHVGADTHWRPGARDVGLGLGWRVPRRWYDADGTLLTERSLLHPGHDLERPGLYLAVRF